MLRDAFKRMSAQGVVDALSALPTSKGLYQGRYVAKKAKKTKTTTKKRVKRQALDESVGCRTKEVLEGQSSGCQNRENDKERTVGAIQAKGYSSVSRWDIAASFLIGAGSNSSW